MYWVLSRLKCHAVESCCTSLGTPSLRRWLWGLPSLLGIGTFPAMENIMPSKKQSLINLPQHWGTVVCFVKCQAILGMTIYDTDFHLSYTNSHWLWIINSIVRREVLITHKKRWAAASNHSSISNYYFCCIASPLFLSNSSTTVL
jgi:hypothetical protein